MAATVIAAVAAAAADHVSVTALASGLRVVTECVPTALSVATGVWVGVGARDEPDDVAGASHFLEHLLFKGTASRSSHDIARAVDRVGGDMNAFTTKEYTAYYTRLPAEHLTVGIGLLGDVLTRPALRDDDIESERQVILEELAMDEDSPEDSVHTLLYDLLFPGHPLGRETAGDRESVAGVGPVAIRDFFEQWYRADTMVVSVAGPVEHDEVVDLVDRSFPVNRVGTPPARRPPGSLVRPLAVRRRPTEQVHLALGFLGVPRRDPDREALDVVNHVLGGGMSSRLFEEIRERRGLAYSVYSSPASYVDTGALSIYAGTHPSSARQVLDLVDVELDRLVRDGLTADELDVARGYLCGAFAMGLEDTSSRMARNAGLLTVHGELTSVEEQIGRWQSVTPDDVGRVAQRVLCGPRSLAAVGPVTKKALSAAA